MRAPHLDLIWAMLIHAPVLSDLFEYNFLPTNYLITLLVERYGFDFWLGKRIFLLPRGKVAGTWSWPHFYLVLRLITARTMPLLSKYASTVRSGTFPLSVHCLHTALTTSLCQKFRRGGRERMFYWTLKSVAPDLPPCEIHECAWLTMHLHAPLHPTCH